MTDDFFKITDEQKENVNNVMENILEKNITLDFDEITSFKFPQDEPFGLQVNYKDTVFCFVIKFSSDNENLLCTGPGAQLRDITLKDGKLLTPPFFHRWSWFDLFDESYISYADPMMFYDDDVRVTWFIGSKKNWYLENLASIIQELAKNQGIINDNILFFGSSAGGHSSVVLGTLLKNSKVLVNHPQFFILNYYDAIVNAALRLAKHGFEDITRDEMINEIKYRLDVIELFKKENYVPYITYYVNVNSKVDIENQLIPFLEEIYKLNSFNGLNIYYYRQKRENPHNTILTRGHINMIYVFCENYLYNLPPEADDDEEEKNVIIKEKTIHQLRYEKEDLKQKYRDIRNSSSWKLTEPLRKFKHMLKRK